MDMAQTLRMPQEDSRQRIYVRVAGRTDTGHVRSHNEDSFVVADLTGGALLGEGKSERFDVGERGVLLAVSDGMGGAQAGEVASALVVESLTRALRARPKGESADALLSDAVEKAHKTVVETGERQGMKMGATLTAAYVCGTNVYLAEVGDSRAYLVRRGQITQLTKDQSYVQLMVDGGLITEAEASGSPYQNIILQAMGHQPKVSVALGKLELRGRDCLLLCSDGLTKHVSDDEMRETLLGAPDLATAASRLVDLANTRGGTDNITVVLAGVGGALASAAANDDLDRTFEVLKSFEQ
jgi:serine/threonine protein phosphatase PrpC